MSFKMGISSPDAKNADVTSSKWEWMFLGHDGAVLVEKGKSYPATGSVGGNTVIAFPAPSTSKTSVEIKDNTPQALAPDGHHTFDPATAVYR